MHPRVASPFKNVRNGGIIQSPLSSNCVLISRHLFCWMLMQKLACFIRPLYSKRMMLHRVALRSFLNFWNRKNFDCHALAMSMSVNRPHGPLSMGNHITVLIMLQFHRHGCHTALFRRSLPRLTMVTFIRTMLQRRFNWNGLKPDHATSSVLSLTIMTVPVLLPTDIALH